MKLCPKCKINKTPNEYWKHYGKLRAWCKICEREYNKKYIAKYLPTWQKAHPGYFRKYMEDFHKRRGLGSIKEIHKLRFGGVREQIIQRDSEKCVGCGISREEHKLQFGRDITVNHIDHQSLRSNDDEFLGLPNNDPNNLETLCLRCHGRKSYYYKVYGVEMR